VFRGAQAHVVVLFSDCLVVCSRERVALAVKHLVDFGEAFSAVPAGTPGRGLCPVHVSDPVFAFVEDRAAALRGEAGGPSPPDPFQFDLHVPTGSLSFRANNAAEKRSWLDALADVLLECAPLDLRLAEAAPGCFAHSLRDDTLHSAVAAGDAIRADVLGLCTAEGAGRACGDLGGGPWDAETLMAEPSGRAGAPGSEAAARGSTAAVCAAPDPLLASLLSALELSARELGAAAKPGASADGAEAAALAEAFAAGGRVVGGPHAIAGASEEADEDGAGRFCEAVSRSLLGCRVDVDEEDVADRTPLLLAAALGDVECLRALLRVGADVSAVDGTMRSGVHLAAIRGHADVVATLAQHGCPVSGHTATDMAGFSALQTALAGPGGPRMAVVVRALLSCGADAGDVDSSGLSALHMAVLRGDAATVEALVAAGADVNLPLQEAAGASAGEEGAGSAAGAGGRGGPGPAVGAEIAADRGCGGITALHMACGAGFEGDGGTATAISAIRDLWRSEAEAAGVEGWCMAGAGVVTPDVVSALLRGGAKPNLRTGPTLRCAAPLHLLGRSVSGASAGASAPPSPAASGPALADVVTSPGGTAVSLSAVSAACSLLLAHGARPAVVDATGTPASDLFQGPHAAMLRSPAPFSALAAPARPPTTQDSGLPPSAQAAPEPSPAEIAALAQTAGAGAAARRLTARLLRRPTPVAVGPQGFLPDAVTAVCMTCGAPFGWFVRRHHCRSCNAVVCSDCSAKACPLFAPGTDVFKSTSLGSALPGGLPPFSAERVCDGCFNKLRLDAADDAVRSEGRAREKARLQGLSAAKRAAARGPAAGAASASATGRAGGGTAELRDAMEGNVARLQEQQERLRAMRDESASMRDGAQSFADMAKQLEKSSKMF